MKLAPEIPRTEPKTLNLVAQRVQRAEMPGVDGGPDNGITGVQTP